jgi:Tol biopolymer transport system component
MFVVPAHGGTVRQLTFDREPTYGAAWTADSREIVFASNRGIGGESLWRIPITGGAPRRLSTTLQGGFYPSISRQGSRLVYTESFKDTNIYAYDGPGFANRSAPGSFGGPKGLILSSRRDDSPSISPAGDRIAFVSNRTGNEEIWVCDRNGGRLVQLTSFKGPGTGTPRWSPDGHWIAFDSLSAGDSNIYVIGADGGAPRRLTTGRSSNFMPSWSAEGKWIYFKSDRSGNDQIWKIPFTRGAATQLTRGGACEAFASPDGKLVYFTKHGWAAIWTVPVDGGPEKPLAGLERFDKIFRSWGVLDRGIYFMSRQDAPHQTIRFFSFATRQITSLVTLDKEPIWNYPDVALSRDGRQLLSASLDQEVNDLMLIENFH